MEDNESILNSLGQRDIFLAKYDKNGNVVWGKRAGGVDDAVVIQALGAAHFGGFCRFNGLTGLSLRTCAEDLE